MAKERIDFSKFCEIYNQAYSFDDACKSLNMKPGTVRARLTSYGKKGATFKKFESVVSRKRIDHEELKRVSEHWLKVDAENKAKAEAEANKPAVI